MTKKTMGSMIFHGLPCFVDSWGPLRRNIKQPQRHIQRARSHFGSGPQPLPSRCPKACVSQAGYKMFSVARLEGRALEHAIAGNSGCHVRMLDKRKRPVLIRSEEAKAARKYMRARYSTLQADLLKRGCSCRGGDRVVKLAQSDAKRLGQEQVSVDLLLLCGYGYALVEAKWSRRSLQGSLDFGMKCLPKLRAATQGRWSSRRAVTAKLVGVLAVSPSAWTLTLISIASTWATTLSSSDVLEEQRERKRKSGVSNWKAWRGAAVPGDERWPSGKPGRSGRRRRTS